MGILRFFILIFPLLLLFVQCKEQQSSSISPEVKALSKKNISASDEYINIGKQILRISKNDADKATGFFKIGDGYYKKNDFVNAIYFFNKSDSVSNKIKDIEREFMSKIFLSASYRKIGLNTKSTELLNQCRLIADQTKKREYNNLILLEDALNLEQNQNYCDARDKRKKIINAKIEDIAHKNGEDDKITLSINYILLAFDYLKCNHNVSLAKNCIQKYDEIYKAIPENKNYLIELTYLAKAMIAAEQQNNDLAKRYFDQAYQKAKHDNNSESLIKILNERVKYNVDNNSEKRKYFDEFVKIKQEKESAIKSAAEKVVLYQAKVIDRKKYQSALYILLIFSLAVLILLLNRYKNKKIKRIVAQIHEDTVNNKSFYPTISEGKIIEQEKESDIKISEEKELELLSKIEDFETGNSFTEKNFTMAKMASIMESNSVYINYVLQKYRGKKFSDYINEIRIKYIVKLLVSDPEYLNYKISYLADVSGFSNHSRFTQIFKKELGISPSEFITGMIEKNKTHQE
ncbi:helix-turn-helix domain-containing protein [Daejeonia sp. YH14]|uniref:helix-turn-helix domain-containing protein n=1 Tax=Daejeonia sp. YH14 TaxID=3439042 RepID=UPI003F49A74D